MRKSLAGVRARVERLAVDMGRMDGCPTCRVDEAMPRFYFEINGRLSYHGSAVDGIATSGTCAVCGRTYPLRAVVDQLHPEAEGESPETRGWR